MARQARSLEQRLQHTLRECQKKDGNKRCADCTERVRYLLMHFWKRFVGVRLVHAARPLETCRTLRGRLVCCLPVLSFQSSYEKDDFTRSGQKGSYILEPNIPISLCMCSIGGVNYRNWVRRVIIEVLRRTYRIVTVKEGQTSGSLSCFKLVVMTSCLDTLTQFDAPNALVILQHHYF